MSKSSSAHGHVPRHQHPLVFIIVFLTIALGALVLILANPNSTEEPPSGTPSQDNAFQCEQATPKGFELSNVEGKTVAEAEAWAAGEGKTIRVVVEDGQPLAATMDYNPDRVNVQVEAGTVTRYCNNG